MKTGSKIDVKNRVKLEKIAGFKIGHAQNYDAKTGCSVILCDKSLNPQHFFLNRSAGFSALVILVFLPILFFPTHNHRLLENSLRFFSDSKYRTLFSKSSIRFCRPPTNKIRVLTSSLSETGKLYGKGGSLGSGILNRATPLFRSYLTHHTCVHTKHTQE